MARDIEISFFRASGPGGQHRNKTETGVRLRHLPTGVTVTAVESRSRHQNLQRAYARLEERLAARRRKPRPRIPTRPTRASRERRLEGKKRRGELKKGRKSPER